MIFPTLIALRKAFPDAVIDVLAGTGVGEAALKLCPAVNTVLRTTFPEPETFSAKIEEIEMLRCGRYDTVLLSTEETGMALKALLCGANLRVGFDRIEHVAGQTHKERFPWLLSTVLCQTPDEHEAMVNLQLASALGCAIDEPGMEVVVPRGAVESCSKLLQDSGVQAEQFVCVHVGTKQTSKLWDVEKFAGVCDHLSAQGISVVFVGSSDEGERVRGTQAAMHAPSVDLTGKTTVAELAALFHRASLFVGNDSGPMHLAAACNLPVAAVFVSSNPNIWGPWAPDARKRIFIGAETPFQQVASEAIEMIHPRRDDRQAAF